MGIGSHDAINDMLFFSSPATDSKFLIRMTPLLVHAHATFQNSVPVFKLLRKRFASVARLSIYVLFIEILPFSFRDPYQVMSNLRDGPLTMQHL